MSTSVFLSQLQSISTTITYMNDRINGIENKINSLNVQTNVAPQDEHVRNIEKINSDVKDLRQQIVQVSNKSNNDQNIMAKVEQFVNKCTKDRIELNNENISRKISSIQSQLDSLSQRNPPMVLSDRASPAFGGDWATRPCPSHPGAIAQTVPAVPTVPTESEEDTTVESIVSNGSGSDVKIIKKRKPKPNELSI